MPRISHLAAALAAATGLMQAAPALAHGIWFAQRADRLALVYGDGAEDLDAVKRLPKITSVAGLSAEGAAVPVKLEPEGRLAFVNLEGRPAVLSATMDNGLWSRDAKGQWHGKGKDQVPDATISGRYFKYNTHLVTLPAGAMRAVPGLALQLVPVGATFPRHIGEPLTVQVLFEGQPLAGAKVWRDVVTDPDGQPLLADAQGRVTLPVRNQGLNVVRAEHESASIDPGKTLNTHHFATLSFALDHEPE
jgi:nickel transport protein